VDGDSLRIDVWLWAARVHRTRSQAKAEIEAGRVRIGGVPCKPSRAVRVGERIELTRAGEAYALEVRALSDQRGPAPVARMLYVEDAAVAAAREAERQRRRLAEAGYRAPPARPDKQARRRILRLQDEH
jgi:ribosome-associated heat shock protein Hsp15